MSVKRQNLVCLGSDLSSVRLITFQISVGDSFYDSGVQLDRDGIIRFEENFVQIHDQGIYRDKVWYQTLGNHDIVKS